MTYWPPCPGVLSRYAPSKQATGFVSFGPSLAAAVSAIRCCLTVHGKLETARRNGRTVLTASLFRKEEQACSVLTNADRLVKVVRKVCGTVTQRYWKFDSTRCVSVTPVAPRPFDATFKLATTRNMSDSLSVCAVY